MYCNEEWSRDVLCTLTKHGHGRQYGVKWHFLCQLCSLNYCTVILKDFGLCIFVHIKIYLSFTMPVVAFLDCLGGDWVVV